MTGSMKYPVLRSLPEKSRIESNIAAPHVSPDRQPDRFGLSCTCSQLGPNHASRREPSSIPRAGQLRHPIVEIRFSVPDQVVDLHVLGPVATKPPATQASQTHFDVSRNFGFRKK